MTKGGVPMPAAPRHLQPATYGIHAAWRGRLWFLEVAVIPSRCTLA
jgi:hypothetical protein